MMDRRTALMSGLALAALGAAPSSALAAIAQPITLPAGPIPGLTIAAEFYPTVVRVRRDFEPGTIHVLTSQRFLYLITGKGQAIRYGIAVGREGLTYHGAAVIGRKVEWPSWKPTPEMIERNPKAYAKFADGMPGGPKNPLGARAMYLFQDGRDTAIRIHGTTDPNSIGSAASNGCFRMVNDHVMDLYQRVAVGTPVMVY